MTHGTGAVIEDFPPAARALLTAFYAALSVSDGPDAAKIKVLRQANRLEDAIITADHGIGGDAETLRILEFYHLTKLGAI